MRPTARTGRPVLVATMAGLLLAACAGSSPPSPSASLPETVRTIESSTQMHLDGVGVGVGNIHEEAYTSADGTSHTGLTAGVFITVEDDTSLNQNIRVHPGQELEVPGYRLHVVAVEPDAILVDVIERPE